MSDDTDVRLAYSIDEVARMAGCGRDIIYRAIQDRQLKAKKLGRLTRIPADEARRFIENLPDLELPKPDDGVGGGAVRARRRRT
jgi:excisionase family DNA binding protein